MTATQLDTNVAAGERRKGKIEAVFTARAVLLTGRPGHYTSGGTLPYVGMSGL